MSLLILYPNLCYDKECYKGTALYLQINLDFFVILESYAFKCGVWLNCKSLIFEENGYILSSRLDALMAFSLHNKDPCPPIIIQQM